MDLEAPPTSIHDGRSFDFSMQNVNYDGHLFSNTVRVSINAIQQIFGNRIISKNGDIHWPPRSPDLSKPRNIDELKNKISSMPLEVIHRVMENIRSRLEECLRRDGHHLDDIIFKK
ncbi:Uncharacterized protein FWK35_00021898 [Aphis craccivora]|uniref:Uncharacterized protein n=1 Tax=Aphis craccivora TaxID=307492 RepID=A0A6G0ZB63_APHCR|nr:Uncharacterized protein FWK35_00021898 [Aphis craccivora]